MPSRFPAAAVYEVVKRIPPGRVSTYGRVGLLAWGVPGRARMVGRVMMNCTDPEVPCHRVIFADGSLSDSYGDMGRMQWRFLLENEGVPFAREYMVDMARALWTGPE